MMGLQSMRGRGGAGNIADAAVFGSPLASATFWIPAFAGMTG